jgi:hypothetical protein
VQLHPFSARQKETKLETAIDETIGLVASYRFGDVRCDVGRERKPP